MSKLWHHLLCLYFSLHWQLRLISTLLLQPLSFTSSLKYCVYFVLKALISNIIVNRFVIRAKKMKMQLTSIPKEVRDDLQFNLIDVKLCQKNVLDK